jgi:crotonobetainyl-CoA:carnitine CoA-transferase CaiB-like acyl-CoA transferase
MSEQPSSSPAAQSALDHLMHLAGRERPDFVTIESGMLAMKTRFHAEETAAAVLAAGGVIAADIWRHRSGRVQSVTVSSREAAAGLVSFLHQKFDDPERGPPMRGQLDAARTAANGFQRAKNGRFIFLHPSFPESTKRLLRVLDCPDEAEAVRETVARWDAFELEDAIAKAGACAGVARAPEEWDATEQGRVLAARPVVEVTKIGESAPEPFQEGPMPLSGVRVLDLTRVLAGPTCARTLAQYGADAMVISSPNLPSVPYFVTDTGHGKLAAFVDLTTEAGKDKMRALVREADVFSQGYRQGALSRLGFDPVTLAAMRPGIVVAEINCYGHEGPWRARPGWEQLGQTVSGMALIHGSPNAPKLQPGAVTDYTTGYLAAFGTMVALLRRAKYGGSYLVRVSLTQTAMWLRSLGLGSEERLEKALLAGIEEIAAYSIKSDTGFGPVTHLRPSVRMSETQPSWLRPLVPLGTNQPVWPART